MVVAPVISNDFRPVEMALKETFVPALFEVLGDGVSEQGVTRLPVKQAGLALPDPYHTAPENWMASCVITGHLVAALKGQVEFRTAYRREGSPAYQSNRRDWLLLTQPIHPLRTGRRPVLSPDTSSQHSGVRWSSGRRTTWPASMWDGRRFGEEYSG